MVDAATCVALIGYLVYALGYITVVTISLCGAFVGGSNGGAFITAIFASGLYYVLRRVEDGDVVINDTQDWSEPNQWLTTWLDIIINIAARVYASSIDGSYFHLFE